MAITGWKVHEAATACDHVAIDSMLDTALQTFVSPLYDASYNAGNYVLVKLEQAVRTYVPSDKQMGDDARDLGREGKRGV